MDVDGDEDPEEAEKLRRLQERWKYDSDDVPPVGPDGPRRAEQNFSGRPTIPSTYFPLIFFNPIINNISQLPPPHHDPLLRNPITHALLNDPSIPVTGPRLPNTLCHSISTWHATAALSQGSRSDALPSGYRSTAVPTWASATHGTRQWYSRAMAHQIKKMQPPTAAPQMRISSNGGMRPPSIPATGMPTNGIQINGIKNNGLQANGLQAKWPPAQRPSTVQWSSSQWPSDQWHPD